MFGVVTPDPDKTALGTAASVRGWSCGIAATAS